MCVHVHACILVWMYMCAHMCVHLCMWVYACMHACMCVHVCTCTCAMKVNSDFPGANAHELSDLKISKPIEQAWWADELLPLPSPPRQLHTGWERSRERKLWKFFFSRIKIIGVSEKALQFTSSSKSPRRLLSFACWCQAMQGRGRGPLQNCLSSLLEISINTEICTLHWSVHGQLVTIPNIFTRTQFLQGMQHGETWSRRRWTDENWFPRDRKKCPSDLTSCLWSCYHFGFLVLT